MRKFIVSRDLNRENLIYFSNLLAHNNIKSFAFFGTLLGLVREQDVLENDDDVDFYVDEKHRDKLIKILIADGFSINLTKSPNHSCHFLQVFHGIPFPGGAVDFYFYSVQPSLDFIVERWNFVTKFNDPLSALHIPYKLIFPLRIFYLNNHAISIPNEFESVVSWLYGPNWRVPLSKSEDYTVIIKNNKPKLVKKMPREYDRFIPKPIRGIIRSLVFGDG
jgi:hypothetical protein